MLVEAEVLHSKTNVNVLNKTLKRLQVNKKSINFAAENNKVVKWESTTGKKLEIINI